jgi:hypothetical protein
MSEKKRGGGYDIGIEHFNKNEAYSFCMYELVIHVQINKILYI